MKDSSMKNISYLLLIGVIWITLSGCNKNASKNAQPTFYRGADLSFLHMMEKAGAKYYDNGKQENALKIFKNHGLNAVRLRLWYHPRGGLNDLANTLIMAKRIKDAGLQFVLDFHYSDIWADPQKQYKPKTWDSLSYPILKDSVFAYTKRVINAFKDENATPDIVQIGNEVTHGMLWPDGEVNGKYNTPQQWDNFTGLLKAGIRGVESAVPSGDTKIMIHIDRGGDPAGSQSFFNQLKKYNVKYDYIGLSYYPWWHGPLDSLKTTTTDLARRFHKPIMVAETAYPWTAKGMSDKGKENPSTLLKAYPATPQGQLGFLKKVFSIVHHIPDHLGIGVLYWEPDPVPINGHGNWTINSMFNFKGEALPSISVFEPEKNSQQ